MEQLLVERERSIKVNCKGSFLVLSHARKCKIEIDSCRPHIRVALDFKLFFLQNL